jgi:hypothetical protein
VRQKQTRDRHILPSCASTQGTPAKHKSNFFISSLFSEHFVGDTPSSLTYCLPAASPHSESARAFAQASSFFKELLAGQSSTVFPQSIQVGQSIDACYFSRQL